MSRRLSSTPIGPRKSGVVASWQESRRACFRAWRWPIFLHFLLLIAGFNQIDLIKLAQDFRPGQSGGHQESLASTMKLPGDDAQVDCQQHTTPEINHHTYCAARKAWRKRRRRD
jgi:hypothetical protein